MSQQESQKTARAFLETAKAMVETRLGEILPPDDVRPGAVHAAMNYSLSAGGKRLRPALVMAATDACGGNGALALDIGCAAEMLHTYTLIHDDLPCMDDDDLRRGKPSCHKAHGEAVALLAGDALLTAAFGVVAHCEALSPELRCLLAADLSRALGSTGVIGGQVEDIACTGRDDIDLERVTYIHSNKTAEFLACCCRMGAMIAGAGAGVVDAMNDFGMHLGLAFQITDDILDIVGDREKLGKSVGKDENTSKATYPACLGLDGARDSAREHTQKALACLDAAVPGDRRDVLCGMAALLVARES